MKTSLSIQAAQIAYFYTGIDLSDKLKVAQTFQSRLGYALDGEPTILPIPNDAPLEIPRIMLQSKDNIHICNIAGNRFDFIIRMPQGGDTISIVDFRKELPKIVNDANLALFNDLAIKSYRLGLIITYQDLPEMGGLPFIKKYFIGDIHDISVETQIHKMSTGTLDKFKVNNWIRLIAKENKLKTGKNPLTVVSDINTSLAEKYDLDAKLAQSYFADSFELSLKTIEATINKDN